MLLEQQTCIKCMRPACLQCITRFFAASCALHLNLIVFVSETRSKRRPLLAAAAESPTRGSLPAPRMLDFSRAGGYAPAAAEPAPAPIVSLPVTPVGPGAQPYLAGIGMGLGGGGGGGGSSGFTHPMPGAQAATLLASPTRWGFPCFWVIDSRHR